jgi:uncharacterized membrane protein HdeD (DUF308 family)
MFTFLSRYWWVLVVRGAMAILLGVFAFVWPVQTVAGLLVAFGAVALIDGTFASAAAIAGRKLSPDWCCCRVCSASALVC